MGCGSKKLIQLGVKKTATERKRPEQPKVGDFHCPDCGFTAIGRTEDYSHLCRGRSPSRIPKYQAKRLDECRNCQHNNTSGGDEFGTCSLYRSIHPDRDSLILPGVQTPYAACPDGRWERAMIRCPDCESVLFDESGPEKCRYCDWSKPIEFPEFRFGDSSGRLAVVTVMVGESATQLGQYTIGPMQEYADRCGAEFVVIDRDQFPAWPIANKFAVGDVGSRFERTLYLDVDCLVRPTLPNLFELYSPGSIWMHRDLPYVEKREFLQRDETILNRESNSLQCWNTGVVLFDQQHSSIWSPPKPVAKTTHTLEQSAVECNATDSGFQIQPLPLDFNLQFWMGDLFKRETHLAHIVHLANAPHRNRIRILNRLTARG